MENIQNNQNKIDDVTKLQQEGNSKLRSPLTSNPQGVSVLCATYDFGDVADISNLTVYGLQRAALVPCQKAKLILELSEASAVQAKTTDFGRAGKYMELEQWRARLHSGISLAPHSLDITANDTMNFASFRVQCANIKGLDGSTLPALTKSVSSATIASSARAMLEYKRAAAVRNNTDLSVLQDNMDTRGFAFAIIARMAMHNAATRHNAVGRDNLTMVELGDHEPSTADTFLTWEMATSHGDGAVTITPVPAQWFATEAELGVTDKVLAAAVARLAAQDVGAVWVTMSGYHIDHGASNVNVMYETRPDPMSWNVDAAGIAETRVEGCARGERYTLWKGADGKVFLTVQLKELFMRLSRVSGDAEANVGSIVYYLRGLSGYEAAAEYLLAPPRTTFTSHIPGICGAVAELHAASYGADHEVKLASDSIDVPPVSFTKAQVATTAMALLRRYDITERTCHYAAVAVAQYMATACVRDGDNGSIVCPTHRIELAPILAYGIQFFDMNDAEGSGSARDVGIGYEWLAGIYALGVVPALASCCELGSTSEEDSGLLVSRTHNVADVAAIAATNMQLGKDVDLQHRGNQGVKSDKEYLLSQKMALVYKDVSAETSKIFSLISKYGGCCDSTVARMRVSFVPSSGQDSVALDCMDLVRHSVQLQYDWTGGRPSCPVEYIPLPCQAIVAHYATPAVGAVSLFTPSWSVARPKARDITLAVEAVTAETTVSAGEALVRQAVVSVPYGTAENTAMIVLHTLHEQVTDVALTARATNSVAGARVAGVFAEARAGGHPALARAATGVATSVIGFRGRAPYAASSSIALVTDEVDFINLNPDSHVGRMSTAPEAHKMAVNLDNQQVSFVTRGVVRDAQAEVYEWVEPADISDVAAALAFKPEKRECVLDAMNFSYIGLQTVPIVYGAGHHVKFGDASHQAEHVTVTPVYGRLERERNAAKRVVDGTTELPVRNRPRRTAAALAVSYRAPADEVATTTTAGTTTVVTTTTTTAPPEPEVIEVEISTLERKFLDAGVALFASGLIRRVLARIPAVDKEQKPAAVDALIAARSWAEVCAALQLHSDPALRACATPRQVVTMMLAAAGTLAGPELLQVTCSAHTDDVVRCVVSLKDAVNAATYPEPNKAALADLYFWSANHLGCTQAAAIELYRRWEDKDPHEGLITYDISRLPATWPTNDRRRVLLEAWNAHATTLTQVEDIKRLAVRHDVALWDVLCMPVQHDNGMVWTVGDVCRAIMLPEEVASAVSIRKAFINVDYTRRRAAAGVNAEHGLIVSAAAEFTTELQCLRASDLLEHGNVGRELAVRAHVFALTCLFTGTIVPDRASGIQDREAHKNLMAYFDAQCNALSVAA